jgi:hypothetical protein
MTGSQSAAPTGGLAVRARKASLVDSGLCVVVAMLAWPFPIARAMLPPLVNVVSILVWIGVVEVAYGTLVMARWGRGAGWYLFDLTSDSGRASFSAALRWGLGWAVASVGAVFSAKGVDPVGGLAARMSGVTGKAAEPISGERGEE